MNKPRTTHTTFYTGAKIRIIMMDGSVLIRKFKEKLGQKWIRTYEEDIPRHKIRTMNYYKPLPHER